jgi:hypothetical protein
MTSVNMQKNKSEIEEMSLWAKKFTNWDKLRTIQNSKIIGSTYVWLFVVPLVAKFLSKINDSIKITIDGNVYEFILTLPFSWESFFYSSLCFVLGNIIYLVLAPELIKDFKDYGEYTGSRRNINHLSRYMTEKYKRHLAKIREKESEDSRNYEKLRRVAGITTGDKSQKVTRTEEDQFWALYDYLNTEYHYFRYICSALYIIGFVLFSWVIIRNIFWVLTH